MPSPAGLYTATFDHYQFADTRRDTGGLRRTIGVTPIASGVDCRRETSGAEQRPLNGVLTWIKTHMVFTDYSAVANGDVIVLSDGFTVQVESSQHRSAIGNMEDFYVLEGIEIEN